MSVSFDLLKRAWVPCIRADGTLDELSLRDALVRAHELRALHGESPLVVAALYRLLLAVLHRVFGPVRFTNIGNVRGNLQIFAIQLRHTVTPRAGRVEPCCGKSYNLFESI